MMAEPEPELGPRAVVQVFAFDEPLVDATLDGIANQTVPAGWTVDYEAWVTPAADGPGADVTVQVAEDHPIFEAHVAPVGKLASRNEAHWGAVDGGADAVVAWDADAPPKHQSVLAAILGPLGTDEGVVAVNGRPRSPRSPVGVVNRVAERLEDTFRPHLHGQLSAVSAYGWGEAGPFRVDDLDQTKIEQVRAEEEFAFRRRLEAVGSVAEAPEAVVLNDVRRAECRVARAYNRFPGEYPMDPYCQRAGVKTFMPDGVDREEVE